MNAAVEAFVGAFLAALGFRVGLLGLGGVWLTQRPWFRRRRVYGLDVPQGQLRRELGNGLVVIGFDALFVPLLLASGAADFAAPTPASVLITLVVGLASNEVWFYASHRLLHTPRLYFIHARHHQSRVSDPMTSVSFHLAEHIIGFVPINLVMVALFHVLPISLAGLLLFAAVTEIGNLYGHLNVEVMPSWFARSPLGKLFIAPSFHAMHHARFTGHYGLYTRVLDRWFGTEFSDYEAVQAQTAAGQPLRSLAERAAASVVPSSPSDTATTPRRAGD